MRDEQKLSSLEGFVVPQGGRRASGRRGGSRSDAEHRARESPKNGAQARRFFGLAGAADRGDPPSGQRGPPALPVLPMGHPPSELRHAIPARSPGPRGPGGSQCRSGKVGQGTGGGCKRAIGENSSSQGRLVASP